MSNVNLDRVLRSINENLNFPTQLVDARTEIDRIDFVTRYAKLINFYNKNNTKEGSWQPFMLKDPVFLMAHISSLDFKGTIRLFKTSCTNAVSKIPIEIIDSTKEAISVEMLNPLFQQIFEVFAKMHKWSYFMENSEQDYRLKVYFQQMIRTKYAAIYWAIKDLFNDLNKSTHFKGINLIDEAYYKEYSAKIWTTSTDQRTFWEILEIKHPITLNQVTDLLNALKISGNAIVGFYQLMVEKAQEEFTILSAVQTNYPDTLLIRAFFELLKSNQDDLNDLSAKHLNFYYKEILKQTQLPAQGDTVYLCADLAKQDRVYKLAEGTTFSAGLDAEKQPIIFESDQDQLLNPAQIKTAFTLVVEKIPDLTSGLPSHLAANSTSSPLPTRPIKEVYQLGFNQQNNIDQVKVDENGSVVGWNTFGNVNNQNQQIKSLGISFASPLLYLLEGQRKVIFTFESPTSLAVLNLENIQFYLSTQTAWFSLENRLTKSKINADGSTWIVEFVLFSTDPSIENFIVNPDGYTAEWPLLKLIFNTFDSLAEPPIISALIIDVLVENVRTFSLGNANGSLDSSKPFQLFGPIVPENAIFYLGNTEIFSKPVTFFNINLIWANLPTDFASYYLIYNAYLAGVIEPGAPTPNFLQRLLQKLSLLGKKKTDPSKIVIQPYFSNESFKVSFEILSQYQWKDFPLSRQATCTVIDDQFVSVPPLYPDPVGAEDIQLFSIEKNKEIDSLSTTSVFVYDSNQTGAPPFLFDPTLQNQVLSFSEKTVAGYLLMKLVTPHYAFGNDLYPKIVAQVALVNADLLFKPKATSLYSEADIGTSETTGNTQPTGQKAVPQKPFLIPPPNVPFAPMVSSITANYKASQKYALDYSTQENSFQAYHYSIFENYLVLDTSFKTDVYSHQIGVPICGVNNPTMSLQLYPSFKDQAVLFLEITSLISGSQLSVLFELNQSANPNKEDNIQISYYYLNENGWQTLKVLNDQTNNFKCSGIITFEVEVDINESHFQMPSDRYWFAITLQGNPDLIGQMSLVKTNGIQVVRSETSLRNTEGIPQLAANQISSPVIAIPELSTIVQPFPSFGGKKSETDLSMNLRVSNQLKIKSRPLTANDFNRIIRQNFETIFYSKVTQDRANRMVYIRLVKKVNDEYASNAFLPMVSACELDQISANLKAESAIERLEIKNFEIRYITVHATVYVQPDYDINGVAMRITQALKVFLSPWITAGQEQLQIDTGVTDSEIAAFLTGFEEVSGVENISFQCADYDNGKKLYHESKKTHIRSDVSPHLLVPTTTQGLICKKAV